MVCFPFAKINIGLRVLPPRSDGFHGISSLFYPLPLHDILEAVPSIQTGITITGDALPGAKEDNMCLKAWRIMNEFRGIPPVHFHLHKKIPAGAGLGGGSADAAFTLMLLNRMFSLRLDKQELSDLALKAGSDCPFFVQGSACMVSGRGEVIRPSSLDLKGLHFVMVFPGVHVATATAYAALDKGRGYGTEMAEPGRDELIAGGKGIVNDFEPVLTGLHPVIGVVHDTLQKAGALFVSMSGSGSAVYGIFGDKPALPELPGMKVFSGIF